MRWLVRPCAPGGQVEDANVDVGKNQEAESDNIISSSPQQRNVDQLRWVTPTHLATRAVQLYQVSKYLK